MSKTFISIFAKSCAIILFPALALFLALFLPSSLHSQIPSYVPTNGLVGYWPFNGNANDESGNGNHGTVNGATLTADRNGNANSAYSFDGVDDFIQAFNTLTGNEEITMIVWAKLTSDHAGQFVHLGLDQVGCPCNGIGLGYGGSQSNNSGSNLLGLSSGVNWINTNYSIDISGTWQMLTLIKDVNNNFNFYSNGQLVFFSSSSINSASNSIFFGSASPTFSLLQGSLDDIAIYNRALTQEEITALYNGTTNNGGGGNGGTAGTPAPSVPQGIPYQAMIRDNNGAALINNPVTVRFSLRQDAIDGTVEYQETHNLTTNAFGLINTHFGTGTATQGTFANINWSNTTKFIQVEANTGSGFVEMGTQQMMSVPFALQSNKATMIKNAGLPVYANNAAALAGGLVAGDMYRTATGDLKIVY